MQQHQNVARRANRSIYRDITRAIAGNFVQGVMVGGCVFLMGLFLGLGLTEAWATVITNACNS